MAWKYWDVAIAIAGFLIQCGLALLGLSLTHWKHKLWFSLLVIGGAIFTGVAVNRGIDSANKVQAQLDRIQRNTENPPTVQVNLPPTSAPSTPDMVMVKEMVRDWLVRDNYKVVVLPSGKDRYFWYNVTDPYGRGFFVGCIKQPHPFIEIYAYLKASYFPEFNVLPQEKGAAAVREIIKTLIEEGVGNYKLAFPIRESGLTIEYLIDQNMAEFSFITTVQKLIGGVVSMKQVMDSAVSGSP